MAHMRAAVEGGHSSAKGPFSALVADRLRQAIGSDDVLLTTSCTAALELAAVLLDLRPGDAVIVPSFSFVTTALAFVRQGARLIFADIEPDTLGIDPAHVEQLVDGSVRAVVPVHYAGVGCDLDGLAKVLAGHPHVDLIEDNAHGLFGRHGGRPLGSFGRFATLSFHETKNFVCGEGGALLLNRRADVARAHTVYDKGTNREAFLHGEVDKYSWVDLGSSFGLSDILAAYLLGQLEEADRILARRRQVYERYQAALGPEAERLGYRTPVVPADRDQSFHMYYVLLENRRIRDRVLDRLRADGIHGTFHYVPLHSAPAAAAHTATPSSCPVTDDVSGRLLRLPFFNSLAEADVDRVASSFLDAVAGA